MAGGTFVLPMPRRCRLRSCPDWLKVRFSLFIPSIIKFDEFVHTVIVSGWKLGNWFGKLKGQAQKPVHRFPNGIHQFWGFSQTSNWTNKSLTLRLTFRSHLIWLYILKFLLFILKLISWKCILLVIYHNIQYVSLYIPYHNICQGIRVSSI